jgi:tetratricopeptide (TPR) repeat protein
MKMRRQLGLWLIVGATLTGGCSAYSARQKDRHVSTGDKYVQSGLFKEAAFEYLAALKRDPRDGDVREKLADAALRAGDTTTALREYVRAADQIPDRVTLQMKAATLLLAAGRFEDARTRSELVLQRDSANVEAHILRANAFIGMKDLDGALTQIEDAIKANPDRGEIYSNLGAIELSLGQRAAAETAFKRAAELAPGSIQAQLALGHFYWLSGQWPGAEEALKRAVAIGPRDRLANRALADFYLATNRAAAAEPLLKTVAAVSGSSADAFAVADYYVLVGRLEDARRALELLEKDPAAAVEARIRLATVDYRGGRRTEAYKRLAAVLTTDPTNPKALMVKARLLQTDRRYDEALAIAREVADRAHLLAAYYVIAEAQTALGRPQEAIVAYNEVIRQNPRATDARLMLSKLNLAVGATDLSLSLAREVLTTSPRNPEARLTAARALLANNDLVRAEQELKELASRYPSSPAIEAELGMLYGRKERLDVARQHFERAIKLQPGNPDALLGLVALDLKARRFGEAKVRADSLVSKSPTPTNLTLAARVYAAVADRPGAERMLKKAIETQPGYLPAYLALGQLYVSQGQLPAARAEFETLARQSVKPVSALTMVGVLLQAEGNVEGARKQYERVLELEPDAPVAANNLAYIHAEAGTSLDLALSLAEGARRREPENASINDTLGYVLLVSKRPFPAIAAFERSVQLEPGNPVYHYHLGRAYLENGDKEKARKSLTAALALNTAFRDAADAKRLLESAR